MPLSGTHGSYICSPELVNHVVLNLRTEYLSPQNLFQQSRAEISAISFVLPWPDFRRLLRLQSVRSKIWVNRCSVRTVCPWHTPTQDRIKCSVWVWSRELLSTVFGRKTLGASDPPDC
ncbi:hypothetical protein PanWU01x14_237040 [Parasponia andersonii]|uniref:Uncharacterized protein n=1 Tax=Parasponia andersonii TaxID=3476 RepID=A0A2P5BI00_PARAD|nr:hypothetical protein PanWU01x14_237040 [Parasponia andersonii]